MADLIGVRLQARYAGGRELEPGSVTAWEIVEKLGPGRYALESRPRGGVDRPPVRIERSIEQLRERCWKRLPGP